MTRTQKISEQFDFMPLAGKMPTPQSIGNNGSAGILACLMNNAG
jgi:hypothetical protein